MNVAWPGVEHPVQDTAVPPTQPPHFQPAPDFTPAPCGSFTPPAVAEALKAHGAAARAELERFLHVQPRSPWLSELVADYPRRPGKMMRAGLCMAAAGLFGPRPPEAVRTAAAIELFHNGLLIHDDIEDDSEERRGLPTLQRLHGLPLALNAGDATLMHAIALLLDAVEPQGPHVVKQAMAATLRMSRETAEGQALELGWRDGNAGGLSDSDYLEMVLKKTAWMSVIWPLQLGLLIGSRGRADPETLARFGFFLGAAFQIQDDLLNFVADPAYGKEHLGDLYEGKRTLMLIHVEQHADADERARLRAMLALPRAGRTRAMVEDVAEMMERHGSIAHARAVAGALAGAAAHEHGLAFGRMPDTADRAFLAGLIPWVFERR